MKRELVKVFFILQGIFLSNEALADSIPRPVPSEFVLGVTPKHFFIERYGETSARDNIYLDGDTQDAKNVTSLVYRPGVFSALFLAPAPRGFPVQNSRAPSAREKKDTRFLYEYVEHDKNERTKLIKRLQIDFNDQNVVKDYEIVVDRLTNVGEEQRPYDLYIFVPMPKRNAGERAASKPLPYSWA